MDKFSRIQVVSIIDIDIFEDIYFQGSVNFHKILEIFYP